MKNSGNALKVSEGLSVKGNLAMKEKGECVVMGRMIVGKSDRWIGRKQVRGSPTLFPPHQHTKSAIEKRIHKIEESLIDDEGHEVQHRRQIYPGSLNPFGSKKRSIH
jgi:hypothetical protein